MELGEGSRHAVADRVRLRMRGRQVGGELSLPGRARHPQARDRAEKDLRHDLAGECALRALPVGRRRNAHGLGSDEHEDALAGLAVPRAASTESR